MTDPATHSAPALHPRLAQIAVILDEAREQLLAAAHAVPAGHRNQRPADDRWSAAEVLAHLARTESSCGRLFSVKAREIRESGAALETETDADDLVAGFERFQLDRRAVPAVAPEMVAPERNVGFDAALDDLLESRERLRGAMAKASGLALATASAPHPRLGVLNVYEWLLMIARHEQRHADQLVEIREAFAAAGR